MFTISKSCFDRESRCRLDGVVGDSSDVMSCFLSVLGERLGVYSIDVRYVPGSHFYCNRVSTALAGWDMMFSTVGVCIRLEWCGGLGGGERGVFGEFDIGDPGCLDSLVAYIVGLPPYTTHQRSPPSYHQI